MVKTKFNPNANRCSYKNSGVSSSLESRENYKLPPARYRLKRRVPLNKDVSQNSIQIFYSGK